MLTLIPETTKSNFHNALEAVFALGIEDFCVCPGSRNSPLIRLLNACTAVECTYWFEERSAAFYALGVARRKGRPVAVITTSGTAAGELLPAAMEAHYSCVPLLLITADRPRRFRGTGAPQCAEQVGLFGVYAHFSQDVEGDEALSLDAWDFSGPAHLNICIEDPHSYVFDDNYDFALPQRVKSHKMQAPRCADFSRLEEFLDKAIAPFVIVSSLEHSCQASVKKFLIQLNAPIYCEAGSGLREDPELAHLQIRMGNAAWKLASQSGYAIDGVMRIGAIPVTRLWRDLECSQSHIPVFSISQHPFCGLSRGDHYFCDLSDFLGKFILQAPRDGSNAEAWIECDRSKCSALEKLFDLYPFSEPALIRSLSERIPSDSMLYLGNSLPIREWDLAANYAQRNIAVESSRGLNGIDGQLSTFFGLCRRDCDNWAAIGDLTCMYDFAALWIVKEMPDFALKIVVVNNGGGKIFSRMYPETIFQNRHRQEFEAFAKCWNLPYLCCKGGFIPKNLPKQVVIELCPDESATNSFWDDYEVLVR